MRGHDGRNEKRFQGEMQAMRVPLRCEQRHNRRQVEDFTSEDRGNFYRGFGTACVDFPRRRDNQGGRVCPRGL